MKFSQFILYVIFSVKHLKEVIPIFRKTSLLSEIGWNSEQTFGSPFLKAKNGHASPNEASKSNNHANEKSDSKKVPLLFCHLTKPSEETFSQLPTDQISDLVLELYSPDRRHVCILKCPDSASASAWFSAIHSTISNLLSSATAEVNNILSEVLEGADLKHMDWIYEKVKKIVS